MMLVLQGTTVEETRQSIVEYIAFEAHAYAQSAKSAQLTRDKIADTAPCNALRHLASILTDCQFADLRKADKLKETSL